MKRVWSATFLSLCTACAGAPGTSPDHVDREAKARPSVDNVKPPPEPSIDYLGLHRSLGLERGKEILGYIEKAFDTCDVGYGYSASNSCRRETFVSLQFQILCRDSEGTISTPIAREDMQPLSGRTLNWSLQGARGTMRLDGEGFGQIRMTFRNSPRAQRLKIAVDGDFLYIRADEVKRLVTPRNWCN